MKWYVTTFCIHIEDSYKVGGFSFCEVLRGIRDLTMGETIVFNARSLFSLAMEWSVHNLLYKFGIERERTKDVDLDYPCDKPEWLYCVLGLLGWVFFWFLLI